MNNNNLQNSIHKELKRTLKDVVYMLWLSDAKIELSADCKKVKIIASSEFKAKTIENGLYKEVEQAIISVVGFLPETDYLFSDEDRNVFSVLNGRTRQKELDKMENLLDCTVQYIVENTDDATILYIAPDIRSGMLSVKDNIATLDFNYTNLLKVVKKYCSGIITKALNELLDRDDVKLQFLYCGLHYEEF